MIRRFPIAIGVIACLSVCMIAGVTALASPLFSPYAKDHATPSPLLNIRPVLYAGDKDGFTSGGKEPEHSWKDTLAPNEHTEIYDNNRTPILPLDTGPGEIVYDDLTFYAPRIDNPFGCLEPRLSICFKNSMALQIHAIANNYNAAMMRMTEQFTAVSMQFTQIIGSFFDASLQQDTQRVIQGKTAEAHKDYHPSVKMCEFGTLARGLMDGEQRKDSNMLGLNAVLMTYYTGTKDSITAIGQADDVKARIEKFKTVYCDPRDVNGAIESICQRQNDPSEPGYVAPERMNMDIDYTRGFDVPLTLDINYSNANDDSAAALSDTEQDLIALSRNLYWPDALSFEDGAQLAKKKMEIPDLRNLYAISSVAHNSFTTIAGMKSRGKAVNTADKDTTSGHFMRNILKELGIDENTANDLIGEYPSYYAMMEFLTNTMYQDPDFYTNLYDKPANVKRIGVTLDAIKLMQGWDRYESALRREMLTSLLVEEEIRVKARDLNDRINLNNISN